MGYAIGITNPPRTGSTLSLAQSKIAPSTCAVQSENRNITRVSPAMIEARLGIGTGSGSVCRESIAFVEEGDSFGGGSALDRKRTPKLIRSAAAE